MLVPRLPSCPLGHHVHVSMLAAAKTRVGILFATPFCLCVYTYVCRDVFTKSVLYWHHLLLPWLQWAHGLPHVSNIQATIVHPVDLRKSHWSILWQLLLILKCVWIMTVQLCSNTHISDLVPCMNSSAHMIHWSLCAGSKIGGFNGNLCWACGLVISVTMLPAFIIRISMSGVRRIGEPCPFSPSNGSEWPS